MPSNPCKECRSKDSTANSLLTISETHGALSGCEPVQRTYAQTLDISGKSLAGAGDAGPAYKALCPRLLLLQEDFGDVEQGSKGVRLPRLSDNDIESEAANNGRFRPHSEIS